MTNQRKVPKAAAHSASDPKRASTPYEIAEEHAKGSPLSVYMQLSQCNSVEQFRADIIFRLLMDIHRKLYRTHDELIGHFAFHMEWDKTKGINPVSREGYKS